MSKTNLNKSPYSRNYGPSITPLKNQKSTSALKRNIYERNQEDDQDQDRLQKSYLYSEIKKNPEVKSYNKYDDPLLMRYKQRSMENLDAKIESILKHNSQLLTQNSTLVQLINQKNQQLQILDATVREKIYHLNVVEEQKNQMVCTIEEEKNRLIQDIEMKNREKQQEFQKLLEEISKLHEQKYQIQNEKNKEIATLKQVLSKEALNQIQNLKKNQMNNVQLYETQIKKYKDNIDNLNYQMESKDHQSRMAINKLEEEVARLLSEIKHIKQINELQSQQERAHHENVINNLVQQNRKNMDIQVGSLENTIKKMKKELANNAIEIQRLTFKIHKNSEENQMEYQFIKEGKQKLEVQMMEFEHKTKQNFREEKQKIISITDDQIETIENTHKNYTEALRSENSKLYELSETKTAQIEKLHMQIQSIREANIKQIEFHQNLIENLKAKMTEMQINTHQQLQLLKIKLAHLHSGDIYTLKEFYQNQISILNQQITAQQDIIIENREKLHIELQEKTEVRKRFQIELSKQKNKVIELKLKLASVNSQFRENISSLGTQMQMTSQTLLKEAHLKQRQSIILQDGKKKLFELINAKDKEIQQLNDIIKRIKQDYDTHLKQKNQEIESLKENNKLLDESQKKQFDFYQKQLKKKQNLLKEVKDQLQNEIQQLKTTTYSDLKYQIQTLQKENLMNLKEIEHKDREKNSLLKELNNQKGVTEKLKLQSSVALEGEKQNSNSLKRQNQQSLRSFYEDTLKSKDQDIEQLKRRLQQKDKDLRQLILKYNILEKKLINLMESQQKLRDFENRILNLGGDANLIKNKSELLRSKLK